MNKIVFVVHICDYSPGQNFENRTKNAWTPKRYLLLAVGVFAVIVHHPFISMMIYEQFYRKIVWGCLYISSYSMNKIKKTNTRGKWELHGNRHGTLCSTQNNKTSMNECGKNAKIPIPHFDLYICLETARIINMHTWHLNSFRRMMENRQKYWLRSTWFHNMTIFSSFRLKIEHKFNNTTFLFVCSEQVKPFHTNSVQEKRHGHLH